MKIWKAQFILSSGRTLFDISKARNIQQALIEWGSNFKLPYNSTEEVNKIIITEIKNFKQLEV